MNKDQIIADQFRQNLNLDRILSNDTSGSLLHFASGISENLLRERFGITEDLAAAFHAAFVDATHGGGQEIRKINSLISSALLPLLVFYPLYSREHGCKLQLTVNGRKLVFTKAFLEVKNIVLRSPSCIDVALVSEDGSTILFLESKLAEMYRDSECSMSFSQAYSKLYISNNLSAALKSAGIDVSSDNKSLTITASTPQYLEGVKQTICHLIGMTKGPAADKKQDEYIQAFHAARRYIYAPIIFDSTHILGNDAGEYHSFAHLYSTIFGENSHSILADISSWTGHNPVNNIEISHAPITYQQLVEWNPSQLDLLVKKYYGF